MTKVGRTWCALALLLGGAAVARAEAVKDLAPPTSYVDDLAGVIDPAAKAQMEALGAEVEREAHATMEVVTIHSLDGDTIEDFATQLEDKWKVGPKGTDRGVILLFAINDHKRRIEVGYGLEGVLNDAKVGDIGRSMVPDLQAGDYGSAILGGERQIADDIAKDAGVTLAPLPGRVQQRQGSRGGGGFRIGPVIFVLVMLFFLFRVGVADAAAVVAEAAGFPGFCWAMCLDPGDAMAVVMVDSAAVGSAVGKGAAVVVVTTVGSVAGLGADPAAVARAATGSCRCSLESTRR